MDALPVINHLLWMAFRSNVTDMTPMKMQKMLYFLNGWYLAITRERLIDEDFEAWPYGPVLPSVYDKLKGYGSQPIGDYLKAWDPQSGQYVPYFVDVQNRPQFMPILEKVWMEYNSFTAIQLSTLTHQPNTPWALTNRHGHIDNELIRNHFTNLAQNRFY